MTMLLITCAVAAVVYGVYWFFTRNNDYWEKRNIKGPKPEFFVGNMRDVFFRKRHTGDVLKDIYDQYKDEKVVGVFRMKTPCLMVNDLELLKDIMVKNFDNFADRGVSFSDEGLGLNLFHADEEKWRMLRSKFSPLFTSGKLRNMFHLLDERGNKFVKHLKPESVNEIEYEVKSILKMYTISSISACAFGMDLDYDEKKRMDAYFKLDESLLTITYFTDLDQMFPGILKKLNSSLLSSDVSKFFNDLVETVFTQRNGKPTGRKDFMDLILELKQLGELQGKDGNGEASLKITNSLTAAQAFVFFTAGYETSASTMTNLMYHIAMDQSIQNKLIEEIDQVTKRHGGKVTYESLSEMSYMHKVFDETLRMYPIVDTLTRVSRYNYTFPDTDINIEKGSMLLINVLGIQRDERYYPDPEKFDPERFSPENVASRHSCAYMPFGIGQRNCIGMRFGKLQSYLCIAKLLTAFRVEFSDRTPKHLKIDPTRGVYSVLGDVHLNFISRK